MCLRPCVWFVWTSTSRAWGYTAASWCTYCTQMSHGGAIWRAMWGAGRHVSLEDVSWEITSSALPVYSGRIRSRTGCWLTLEFLKEQLSVCKHTSCYIITINHIQYNTALEILTKHLKMTTMPCNSEVLEATSIVVTMWFIEFWTLAFRFILPLI